MKATNWSDPLNFGDPSVYQRGIIKTAEGLRSETDDELRIRILNADMVTPNPRN